MAQTYNVLMFIFLFSSLDVLLIRNTSAFLIDVSANNHQVTKDPPSTQQAQRVISFQRDMNLLKQEVEILKRSHQNYPSEEISQMKSVIMSLKETMRELNGEVQSLQVAKVNLIEELKQVRKEMYRTENRTAELALECTSFLKDLSHLTTNQTKKLENSLDILKKSVAGNISSLNQKISHTDAQLKLISFTTNSCCQNVKVLLNKTHLLTSHPSTTMTFTTPTTGKVNNAMIGSSVFEVQTTISSTKPSDIRRTVIFFQKYAVSGQYLFIRGGIDERHSSDGPLANPNTHFGLHTGNVIGNVIGGGSVSRSTTQKETTTVSVSSTVAGSTSSDAVTTPSTIPTTMTPSSTSPVLTTTSSPKCNDTRRTVIFFQEYTISGQYLFIRGGIDERHRSGCRGMPVASMSNCSIPIQSHELGSSGHYAAYDAWRKGDKFLDWHGPEPGQGTFQGEGAFGTPAVWTTKNPSDGRYSKLNSFGEHYWLVDIDMDCCKTINGWFEVKAYMGYHDNGDWEHNIFQGSNPCNGTERPPYENTNHWAKCGMMNVFHFNQSPCQLYSLK